MEAPVAQLLSERIKMKINVNVTRGRIHNTSFATELTDGTNKLECLYLESISSLLGPFLSY